MRKITTTLLITLLGLMSFSAQAGIEKGDKTISIFGALTSPDQGDDFLFLQAAGGLFLSDTLEAQGIVQLLDSGPVSVSAFGANANLYFPGQNPDIFPYVGGGLTITILDAPPIDETELGFNVQAGIKQFVSEQVTINYQLQFVDAGDYEATIASIGFSIFLD